MLLWHYSNCALCLFMNRFYFLVSHASWLGSQPCLFSTSTGKVSNRGVETRFIRFNLVRHSFTIRHVVKCRINPNLASASFFIDFFVLLFKRRQIANLSPSEAGQTGGLMVTVRPDGLAGRARHYQANSISGSAQRSRNMTLADR